MGYSFNRVRTAAIKSIGAMQERLQNIAADFADVDQFLVNEAQDLLDRMEAYKKQLEEADDPFSDEKAMQGYTFAKVRTPRKKKMVRTREADLFDRRPPR